MPGSMVFGRNPTHHTPKLSNWVFPSVNERINPGGILPLLCSVFSGTQPTQVRWYTDGGTLLATRNSAPWGMMVYDVPETSSIRCAVTTNGVTKNYWRSIRCTRTISNGYIASGLGTPALAIIPDLVAPLGSGYAAVCSNLGSLGGMFKSYPVVTVDYPVVTSYPNISDSNYLARSSNLLPLRQGTKTNGNTIKVFGSDGTNAERQVRTTLPTSQTKFLHDGSGASIYATISRATGGTWNIIGSATGSPPGMRLTINSTGHLALDVWNDAGTQVLSSAMTMTLTANVTYVVSVAFNSSGGAFAVFDGTTITRQTFGAVTYGTGNGSTPIYIARSLSGYQGATLAFATRHSDTQVNSQLASLWTIEGSISSYSATTGRRIVIRGDCWSVGTWDVNYVGPSGPGWATYGWQHYITGRDYEVISLGKYEPNALTNPTQGIAALANTEVLPHVTSGTNAIVPLLLDGDDYLYQSQTSTSLYNAVTAYFAQIHGWNTGGLTVRTTSPPRVAHYSSAAETQRLAYNALIRANASALPNTDAYLDLDAAMVQTYGSYLGDGVLFSDGGAMDDFGHPTDLGYRLWGHLMGPILLSL